MEYIHCHTDNPVDAKYCRYCGQILKRNYEWIWIILMIFAVFISIWAIMISM